MGAYVRSKWRSSDVPAGSRRTIRTSSSWRDGSQRRTWCSVQPFDGSWCTKLRPCGIRTDWRQHVEEQVTGRGELPADAGEKAVEIGVRKQVERLTVSEVRRRQIDRRRQTEPADVLMEKLHARRAAALPRDGEHFGRAVDTTDGNAGTGSRGSRRTARSRSRDRQPTGSAGRADQPAARRRSEWRGTSRSRARRCRTSASSGIRVGERFEARPRTWRPRLETSSGQRVGCLRFLQPCGRRVDSAVSEIARHDTGDGCTPMPIYRPARRGGTLFRMPFLQVPPLRVLVLPPAASKEVAAEIALPWLRRSLAPCFYASGR